VYFFEIRNYLPFTKQSFLAILLHFLWELLIDHENRENGELAYLASHEALRIMNLDSKASK